MISSQKLSECISYHHIVHWYCCVGYRHVSYGGAYIHDVPYHTYTFWIRSFIQVDAKYELIKPIGHGAYGVVISALNTETGQKVAIKKITRAFDDLVDAKRILREITLLRKFDHENVSFIFASRPCLSAACLRCLIQRMYVCMHDVCQVRTCCVRRAWCFLQESTTVSRDINVYAWWQCCFRSPFTRYPRHVNRQYLYMHARPQKIHQNLFPEKNRINKYSYTTAQDCSGKRDISKKTEKHADRPQPTTTSSFRRIS